MRFRWGILWERHSVGIFHCCIWQKNVQRKINLIKSLNTVLYLQKRHCYGSKTCCEGCFMLILFHVLSLIWGQLYRSLDNGLTCSGNGCLEQQLGTTEEPIQPVGINSLLLHWFFILLFGLFWFRSSLFFGFWWQREVKGAPYGCYWILWIWPRVCACFAELTGSRWKRCHGANPV